MTRRILRGRADVALRLGDQASRGIAGAWVADLGDPWFLRGPFLGSSRRPASCRTACSEVAFDALPLAQANNNSATLTSHTTVHAGAKLPETLEFR